MLEVVGQKVRGRQYPLGVVEVENSRALRACEVAGFPDHAHVDLQ